MSMNTQGRPTGVGTAGTSASGSALLPDEPLLFEIGDTEHSGVDLPDVDRATASAVLDARASSIWLV